MALTQDLKRFEIDSPGKFARLNFPVGASAKVWGNEIAFTDSNGRLIDPAAGATSGKCWGIIDRQVDNSAGAACAVTAEVLEGIFAFPYCSTDGFAEADVGAAAWVWDGATVTKTQGSLIKAGKVVAVAGIGQGVGLPAGYVAVAFGLVGGAF